MIGAAHPVADPPRREHSRRIELTETVSIARNYYGLLDKDKLPLDGGGFILRIASLQSRFFTLLGFSPIASE